MAKSSTLRLIAHFTAAVLLVLLIMSASRTSCQAENLNSSDPDHYSPQLLPAMIRSRGMPCYEDTSHCAFSSCSNVCKAKGVKSDRAFCLHWTDKQGHDHVQCCCPLSAVATTKTLIPPHPFTCYHDLTGCTTCGSFCGAKGFIAENAPCFTRNDDSGRAHTECCCAQGTV